MGTLVALNVHPLKSGAGIPLTEAVLTPRGLRHDREFMLVDSEGAFLSQRRHPRMALLRTAYDGEVLSVNEFVHKTVDDGDVGGIVPPSVSGRARDATGHESL